MFIALECSGKRNACDSALYGRFCYDLQNILTQYSSLGIL